MKTIAQELGVKDFPLEIRDGNGNLIYKEDEYVFWQKWERNKNGKLIYYENSNPFWVKWEYDEQGHEIYYEDSEGQIRDNRPKEQQLSTKI
jgi:hydroxymethylpyrimidine pyrophosphatase-like HAD family hydrolase